MNMVLFGIGTAMTLMVISWLVRYRGLSVRWAVTLTSLIWGIGLATYFVMEIGGVGSGVAGLVLGGAIGLISSQTWAAARRRQ